MKTQNNNNNNNKEQQWALRKRIVEQRLQNRDTIVQQYQKQKNKDQKTQLCRFYLRGLCIFTAENCHYAHGVQDLYFKRLNLEDFEKKLEERVTSGDQFTIPKAEQENGDSDEEDKESQEASWVRQPSLQLEYSYKILYDYQDNLLKSGELQKPFTLEEINKDRGNRRVIREVLHREVQQEFIKFLFKQYNRKYLPKDFISAFFKQIGWQSKFKKIVNSYCCYEVQDPKIGPIIIQLPQGDEFDDIVYNATVKLFKNHDWISKVPVRTSDYMQLYREDLMKNDHILPDINWYVFQKKSQLDDVLQEITKDPKFIEMLSKELGISKEEIDKKQPLFQHEKDFNLQMRNTIISKYQANKVTDGKSVLCRFFMRGLCIFEADECKYAHGIKDLQFKKIDIEEWEKEASNKKKEEDYKAWEKQWADVLKGQQPSLNLEFKYRNILEYQEKFYSEGKLKEKFTLKQLNSDDKYRRDIKVLMHTELTQEFMLYLYQVYPEHEYFKRTFVDKCFQSIGWMTNWHKILDGKFAYEVKLPQVGPVIKLIPSENEFKEIMEDAIIQIVKDNDLLKALPVTAKTVSKAFYKDIMPQKPLMPTLNIYLKKRGIDIDIFLDELQNDKEFKTKLAKACNVPAEQVIEAVLFDSTETELYEFMKKMQKILHDLIEKSHLGFILYSRFEEAVQKRCKKDIDLFNNNYQFIKRVQKAIALKSGVLVINLASELYLFSLHKFISANVDHLKAKYIKKLNNKCSKKPHTQQQVHKPHAPLISGDDKIEGPGGLGVEQKSNGGEAQSKNSPNKAETKEMPKSQFTREELAKEMDLDKIVVVDTVELIEQAYEHMSKAEDIAIDLEGNLSKEGMIELIQCACGDRIWIFDIYKALKTSEELHSKMVACVKKLMENPRICKVFHDCRKDSLALHCFANSCTLNSYDVSGLYMLVEHLKLYNSLKEDLKIKIFANEKPKGSKEESKTNDQLPSQLSVGLSEDDCANLKGYVDDMANLNRLLDEIKSPGLNEVLLGCGASHGANTLKSLMKKRFNEAPREYFLKRPIDLDFLVYSAKDVEDLVEVRDNLNKALEEQLVKFVGSFEKEKTILLAEKVSKTYVLHGCTNC